MPSCKRPTMLAVFSTDKWHTYDSYVLIGLAYSVRGAIHCINHEQKRRGLKPISRRQVQYLQKIRQTQSADDIDGEYVIDKVEVWDDRNPNQIKK